MARPATLMLALVSATVVAVGWVADRTLDSQISRARADALAAATETARLSALSVRATLAAVEQRVLTQTAPAGVLTERLPTTPVRSVPRPGARPYSSRSRAELAKLLHVTSTSASGLPEAVLARLALGDGASVSVAGEPAPPDVASRLLSGAFPVREEDLPFLARALGVGNDTRVARLRERLRAAPAATTLPRALAFRRARRDFSATTIRGAAAPVEWGVEGR